MVIKKSTGNKKNYLNIKDNTSKLAIYYFFGFDNILMILPIFGISLNFFQKYHIIGILKSFIIFYFFYKFIKLKIYDVFAIYSILLILMLISMLSPNNIQYVFLHITDINFLFEVLPIIFILRLNDNPKKMLIWMKQAAYIAVICNIIYVLFGNYDNSNGMNYMTFGYNTLIPWAIITYSAFDRKKINDILVAFASGIFLIIYGSRGAAIGVIIFIAYCNIIAAKRTIIAITRGTFLIICMSIAYYKFQTLLAFLINITESIGISSRTLWQVMSNTLTQDDARKFLYNSAWQLIKNNPLGYGIGADNYYFGGMNWNVHNGYLELLINFGIFFGGFIIITIIIMAFYMLIICKDKDWSGLFGIFFIVSIPQLMFSYSIYLNYSFFASVTIALAYIKTKHQFTKLDIINIETIMT